MSVKEDARQCERCATKWFAVRAAKAPKPRWFDEAGTPWGSGAARVTRLQGNYAQSQVSRDRWSRCPNCGSVKVKTVSPRNFVPTGAQPAASPPPAPDESLSQQPAQLRSQSGHPADHKPAWDAVKAFMKVHWRIVLAIFCSIGVLVMPFAGETVGEKVGGSLAYLAGAIVFWTLHIRPTAPKERVATPAPQRPTPAAHRDEVDMTIDDGWSQRLANCGMKASVFNEVGAATKSDAVRSWLSSIADDTDAQLVLADDLAALGRSIEPEFNGDGTPKNSAAQEAWNRLGDFENGLDEAINSAAQIRLNSLSPTVSLDSIRGQLQMLKTQLPTLDVP